MVKSNVLKIIALIIGVFLLGFIFINYSIDNVLAARKPALNYVCGYDDVTNVFKNHGVPALSAIKDIEKIDERYFSLHVYNNAVNMSEIYLYYLGRDGLLNTADDLAFFIDSTHLAGSYYPAPVLALPNGNIMNDTLYWVKTLTTGIKEVKSCTLTSVGCINTFIRFTLPQIALEAVAPSYAQDRIYLAIRDQTNSTYVNISSSYKSCSLIQNNFDACIGNYNNYITHSSGNYAFYKNVMAIGFVSTLPIDPATEPNLENNTYLFDINLHNTSVILLPSGIDADSIASFGVPGVFFAVRHGINSVLNDSLVIVYTNPLMAIDLESIYPPVDWDPADLILGDVVVEPSLGLAYKSSGGIIGKIYGQNSVNIYNSSSMVSSISLKAMLNDKSILGIIAPRQASSPTIVRFRCKP